MDFLFKIKEYLKGELSYDEAVSLYNSIGTNNTLKKLFLSGEDDYSREKMTSEFEKILSAHSITAEKSAFKSYTQSKNADKLQVELLPEALRIKYHELRPIINEMRNLHAKLPMFPTKYERHEAAERIVQLTKARRIIWDRIDYFKDHGTDHPMFQEQIDVPVPPENKGMDVFEAKHKLVLLRSRRSKLKNRTDRLKDYREILAEIELLETFIQNQS